MLLDILMPEMDGYEVPARLKGHPARRDLPVMVISPEPAHKRSLDPGRKAACHDRRLAK